ncbi:hypothetical protein V6N13_083435 [Hibiscus sabdariffa]|uniref:Uncharacterized protein n=1 Tax=Hibiscus sabdariffa TaxID=183260 RepID=A0ABR2SYS6_9ROSI
MHKFVVFLVIAFHLVLSVERRLLKSVSKNDSKQVLPPPTPTKTSNFVDSVEGYEEDFRPTTPGNSPGAGDDERSVGQKPGTVNGKHSVAGDKDPPHQGTALVLDILSKKMMKILKENQEALACRAMVSIQLQEVNKISDL